MTKTRKARERVRSECLLKFHFGTRKQAADAMAALSQETEFKKRGGSEITARGKTLEVRISADDPVALRATANSYLRLLSVIDKIEQET
ncbi:MAG: KEOPS complex subunit Pcc1 [Candidatus Micrarchaeia archaeon]